MDKVNAGKENYANVRRQTYIIPKRRIHHRYPMIYISACTTVGLLIFFSRPIYDAFFRKQEFCEPVPPEKRRELLQKAWSI